MVMVEVSTTLRAPPNEVFDLLVDPENDPRWCDAVRSTSYEGGAPPREVGARYVFEEGFGKKGPTREGHIELTHVESPRRIVSVATTADRRYVITYDLTPDGHGGTVMTQTADASFAGTVGKIDRFFWPLIRIQYRRQLRALRKVLAGRV